MRRNRSLNEGIVRTIRRLHDPHKFGAVSIAHVLKVLFGVKVNVGTIEDVILGKNYRWVK